MLELLLSGGKRLPGSNAENLYIRPAELATLMGDLVKIINQDKEPRTDELVERYLTNRFTSEIEKEYMARFHRDLLQYAKDVLCKELNKLNRPQSESERTEMDERFKKEYNELKRKCYDTMICRTRCNILGRDLSLRTGFNDDHERQQAFHDLPVPIQHRLNIVESEMNNAREAQMLIEQIRTNLTVSDLKRQTMEKEKLLQQMRKQLVAKHANLKEEKRINKSLNRGDHWRVGVAPCRCGAPGKAYNMIHIDCHSDRPGRLYYYNKDSNRMVCDACREVISRRPEDARCTKCHRRVIVTKVY